MGPIKNYEVRDECYVLDWYDYDFWTQTANNVLKNRTTDLQIATQFFEEADVLRTAYND